VEGSGDGHHSPWGPVGEFSSGQVYRGLMKALGTGTFLHRGLVMYHGGSIHQEL